MGVWGVGGGGGGWGGVGGRWDGLWGGSLSSCAHAHSSQLLTYYGLTCQQ